MYLGCVVQWFHCLGVFWVFLHIYRLIGFRNRILVFVNWAWDYLFYENQIRWITRE
jgi:NADH dehydrogenase